MASDIESALAGAIPASALQPTDAQAKAANDAAQEKPDTKESDARTAKIATDQKNIETARKERDTAEGERPKLPELAPEPKPEPQDPMQGYVSAIGLLGAIGSMFTRRPMTNTMNAAAAVINATKAGSDAEAEKKYKAWKEQNDNAFKLLDYQNKIYDSILKNKTSSVEERVAEMQAHASMFKDDYMMQLAKDGHIEAMQEHQEKMIEAVAKGQEATVKVEEAQEKQGIYKDWLKENPNAKASEKADMLSRIMNPAVEAASIRAQTVGGQPTWSPKAIEAAAKAVANGLPLAKVAPGLSAKNPNRDAIMNRAAELNPDLDLSAAEVGFDARVSEARRVGTSTGLVDVSSRLLDETLPLARTAVAQVDLSKFTDYNSLHNYALRHTSDKDLAAADAALQGVASDYAQLLVRNGQSTDAARSKSDSLSNMQMGPEALEAVFSQIEKESAAARTGTEKALNDVTTGGRPSLKTAPSQEDLEHTAKIHDMTVDEVKKQLGIQ